jgi:shikimate kinase
VPRPHPDPDGVKRIVLVGMMAAGKSVVGAELARRLDWRHLDLDRTIEADAGIPVAAIFREEGEAGFRAREAGATRALAGCERTVLSVGGGWVTEPSLAQALGGGSLTVWLQAEPDEIVRRAADAPGERPLLAVADPLGAVHALLAERTPHYARADLALPTTGRSVREIAERILDELRARGAPTRTISD